MTKRLTIASAFLFVALLGLWLWKTAGPRERAYEGVPLTRWLAGHVASSAANPPYGTPGLDAL